jgi:hypothetical protein
MLEWFSRAIEQARQSGHENQPDCQFRQSRRPKLAELMI